MRSYFSVTALKIICLSLGFDNMPVMNLSVSLFGIIPLGVCYLLGSVYLCFQSNLGSFWPLFFLPFLPLTLWTPMMCVFVPVIISVQNVRLSFFSFCFICSLNLIILIVLSSSSLFFLAYLNMLWNLFREFVVLVIMLFSSRFWLIIFSNFSVLIFSFCLYIVFPISFSLCPWSLVYWAYLRQLI